MRSPPAGVFGRTRGGNAPTSGWFWVSSHNISHHPHKWNVLEDGDRTPIEQTSKSMNKAWSSFVTEAQACARSKPPTFGKSVTDFPTRPKTKNIGCNRAILRFISWHQKAPDTAIAVAESTRLLSSWQHVICNIRPCGLFVVFIPVLKA